MWYNGSGTGDRRFLHANQQGSIIGVSDVNGNLLAANTYDEFGVPGPNNQGAFQYTGQLWLPDAGLYYYKARIYSPTLGRFLQTDPIGYGDGLNWYNYANGDPVNLNDPSGLNFWSDLGNFLGGVGSAISGFFSDPPSTCSDGVCTPVTVNGGGGGYGGNSGFPSGAPASLCGTTCGAVGGSVTPITVIGKKPSKGASVGPQNTQHQYHIRVPNNCSASDSMWALQQPNMSAPGSPQAQEGTTRNIQLWGNGGHNLITQVVNSAVETIINIAEQGHQFYPCQVVFQVTPNGSGSIVDMTGTGSGPGPLWHDIIGYAFLGSVAENLAISCGAPGN